MTELLSDDALAFVTERHLATLSTLHPNGSIHVVAVGFTYRDGIARVITSGDSRKVANVLADGRASVSQVEGIRWLTLQGVATIARSPEEVALGVELYSQRYRQPRVNPLRVVIELEVQSVLGSGGMRR